MLFFPLGISQQQLTDRGPVEFIHEKQDLFLSMVIHGNKAEITVLLKAFGRILKSIHHNSSIVKFL